MPEETPPAEEELRSPLAQQLQRALAAHPILKDQKKLRISERGGVVRLEGLVFTRDMLRQVYELADRLPGGESILIHVDSEIHPQQDRKTTGRVPEVSPGPSNVDPTYSTEHLRKRGR